MATTTLTLPACAADSLGETITLMAPAERIDVLTNRYCQTGGPQT